MAEEDAGKPIDPNGEGTHPAADGDKKPADSGRKKIEFTAEQQEIVDSLISRSYGKAFEKATADFEKKLQEANARIDELTKTSDKNKKKSADDVPPEVSRMQARLEEMQAAFDNTKTERDALKMQLEKATTSSKVGRKKELFLEAAKDIRFFDPLEVFKLTEDELVLDEQGDRIKVMNPKTGQERHNAHMEPMSLQEFLADIAKRKQYLVQAANSDGGTGSAESRRLPTDERPVDFNKMTPAEFEAYKQSVKAKAF